VDLTEDQVDELDPSEDWTNLIDRGGLMHINNGTEGGTVLIIAAAVNDDVLHKS